MIKKFISYTIDDICCSICGDFGWLELGGYCNPCLSQLLSRLKLSCRKQGRLQHLYLLDWKPDGCPLVSKVLLLLKHRPSHRFYSEVSQMWLKSLACRRGFAKTVLVPLPSSTGSEHSFRLVESIAQQSGFEIWKGLKLTSAREQKKLRKIYRSQRQIKICNNYSIESLRGRRVILVDDVLTTGSTVFAAQRALRGVYLLEVWTIAYRHEIQSVLRLKS